MVGYFILATFLNAIGELVEKNNYQREKLMRNSGFEEKPFRQAERGFLIRIILEPCR